jgi:predicted nucleotidyltransferase
LADSKLLADFCRSHRIIELRAFGSVLRKDFNQRSDVDLLYVADGWGLRDLVGTRRDFIEFLGRDVDLVSLRAVESSENPYRKKSILEGARVIYVA